MKPLLIIGPDSTLRDTTALAKEIWPNRRIEGLYIPSKDYYQFDFSELVNYRSSEWCICVAVNEFYINDVRRAMYESLAAMDYEFVSLISPGAHVSASALIGVNTIIHAGCFVGANTTIGDLCVLRPNAVISEDVALGNYVTIEANVTMRELVKVGDYVTICANSSVHRGASVGSHCYLNVTNQYSGNIMRGTFYSPNFANPIHIFGLVN